MKWKWMAKTVGFLLAALGIADLPVDATTKEMNLSAEQEATAKKLLGNSYEDVRKAINKELLEMSENNFDLKAIQDELDAFTKQAALLEEEQNNDDDPEQVPEASKEKLSVDAQIAALRKTYDAKFKALIAEGVGDKGKVIDLTGKMRQNSSTHLNASGMSYDAFEGRSWNEKAAGISAGSSNFNDKVDIPLLQGDIEHFVRKNPTSLESIFNDFEALPSDWAKLTGIIDRVVSGLIAPSEVTQGDNQGGWNPKGEILIDTEVGQVYDKKIDITLTGAKLKQIEKSWLTYMNSNDGSHPWKTTFVGFLLGEYIKQVALDSRIAQVKGIYVKSPKNITGANVNSQNGLLALWYYYRDVVQKYTAFDMGNPTKENICDYIKEIIEKIPEKDRNEQGWEIELSYDLLLWYKERAGEFYALHYATDLGKTNYNGASPLNYPNFKFQPLIDQTNTLFIGITKSKNVENLQFRENEKGEFTMTHDKRDTNLFADFKEGIRFIQVGRKLEAGDPQEFQYQKLYSNTCPIFASNVRVPLFDKGSTVVNLTFPEFYPHLKIVQNDYSKDITNITGVVAGQLVTITGNADLAANRLVKSNATLLLTADFQLNTGGTLTMITQEDLKLKELYRTNAPAAAPETSKTYNTGIVDVTSGTEFYFGGSATVAITSIINGSENKTIKIHGTDAAGVDVTLSDVGNINVASGATLGTKSDYVQLTLVDGVWYEVKRVIA